MSNCKSLWKDKILGKLCRCILRRFDTEKVSIRGITTFREGGGNADIEETKKVLIREIKEMDLIGLKTASYIINSMLR